MGRGGGSSSEGALVEPPVGGSWAMMALCLRLRFLAIVTGVRAIETGEEGIYRYSDPTFRVRVLLGGGVVEELGMTKGR